MNRLDVKTYLAYVLTSIKSALALRESFILQSFFMMLSNVIFFSFWWIYFNNFQSIKGWTLKDMACLYGIVSGSYGIFCVFFGSARFIARMIYEGDLDAFMIKPRNLLLQVIGVRSISAGWGDIISGLIMILLSGYATFSKLLLILTMLFSSTCIILAFSISMGSLSFWIGDAHAISKQLFEFLLTFSNYPKSIYFGGVKFLLLSLIPSGFIGYMPVEVIRDFDFGKFLVVISAALVYLLIAKKLFYLGLKRYASGNKIGFRI